VSLSATSVSGRALALVAGFGLIVALARSGETARYDKAPEFPSQDPKLWIGPPQSMKALEGKVVILDVWTFG
jgi:hypothetical protein